MKAPTSPPADIDSDRKKRPLVAIALSIIILVSLSLVGLQGWSTYAAREAQLQGAEVATGNMARAMADHAVSALDLADSLLAGVIETVPADTFPPDEVRARQQRQLAARVARFPMLDALAIEDEHGKRILSSAPVDSGAPPESAERDYFIYHRVQLDGRMHIGTPRRNPASASWILPVSRRLQHADGSFAGVAVADINLAYFRDYYSSFNVGRDGFIMLALDKGELLVQAPQTHIRSGSDAGLAPVFGLWRQRAAGAARSVGAADGEARLYSYRHLARHPLLIAVAQSEDEVLESWWTGAYLSSASVALVLLVLLWMSVRLLRQLDIRDRLETELRNAQLGLVTKNRSLKLLARNDSLTGIANRRHFDARLDTEFKRAAREGSSLALVLMDVDYFKKYNDRYGHPAGDSCLQFIGQSIRAGRRSSRNLAARVGGEEFAILLPDTDLYGAIAVAESIRKSIAAAQREHQANPGGIVTVSCGVHALLPGQGKASPKVLVEAADQALYQAKAKGRNCVSPDAVEVALRGHRLPVANA